MKEPSTVVVVNFDDYPRPNFTYSAISLPPPWFVSESGHIVPAARSRVIELQLQSFPAGARFHGVRLATSPAALRSHPKQQYPDFNDTKIVVDREDPTTVLLDDDRADGGGRIWYEIGIQLDGEIHWDDPKIYNPPDE